ncbi:MAG: M1 family peptidase, partial [Flavobacteriaceae bacterium]
MDKTLYIPILFFAWIGMSAQGNLPYWQQHVDYTMEIDMDVNNFQYSGTQKLVYTNHSPDTLHRVFYHMYFNAFQPGSEMDMRLQSIIDPDSRMVTPEKKSKIASLSPSEIGYLRATSLKQDGAKVQYALEGTILVVDLANPILPGGNTSLDMVFEGQVPPQIRRSGRNSAEGIALSMVQWYPKMAEYDFEGWHDHPYIGREFHGVWGDFDVKITIDKDYVLGGSGYLQNPDEVGHGYGTTDTQRKRRGKKLTWHFKAPMVHDFMWAADPDYLHDVVQIENGPTMHFLYQNDPTIIDNWKKLQPKAVETMEFFSK